MKPWHQATIGEVQTFFKTDLAKGLDEQEVLNRLHHNGKHQDHSLPPELARVYKVSVIRQGRCQKVSLNQIVLGDVVTLKPGNRVPADLRLFKVNHLKIDESEFGGQHLPITKNTYATGPKTPYDKQKGMAFGGTFVTEGQGLGIVVARGTDMAYQHHTRHQPVRVGLKGRLIARRLQQLGIVILNRQHLRALPQIDMVFFDAELTDKEMTDTIRRLQLVKKISCKFLVSQTQADRLQAEFIQAKIIAATNLAKLTPMNLVDATEDAQFITGADQANTLKIIKTLQQAGRRVLWVSDGQLPMPVIQIADVSLVIGGLARDDIIRWASLVAPQNNFATVSSIFYNKK
jgi:magnesium-transporting ATPase (P-type)